MGEQSKIEWCDSTVNLWQGCDKVSPGCAHCYAAAMDARFNGGLNWKGLRTDKRKSGTALAMKLDRKAAKLGIRYRVFNGSMNDWLDEEVPIEWLADLLALIHSTPNLDWLLLSKRPENWKTRLRDALECMSDNMKNYDEPTYKFVREWIICNPPSNVWIGTTVENQEMADKRISQLLKIPAKVRFLSCEPLISSVDISQYIGYNPVYESETTRNRGLRSGQDGTTGNPHGRDDLESSGTARQSLEPTTDIPAYSPAQSGTRSRVVFSSEKDDRGAEKILSGASVGMVTFPRTNCAQSSNQSHQRNQEGQSTGKPGGGDGIGKHTPCRESSENWPDRSPVGTIKFLQQTDRRADRGHSDDLRRRELDAATSGESVWSDLPDNIKDSEKREASEAVGTNSRLHEQAQQSQCVAQQQGTISLCIVGGESGPKARPMHPDWARSLRDQCKDAGVPFFMKQMGGTRKPFAPIPDDLEIKQFPTP